MENKSKEINFDIRIKGYRGDLENLRFSLYNVEAFQVTVDKTNIEVKNSKTVEEVEDKIVDNIDWILDPYEYEYNTTSEKILIEFLIINCMVAKNLYEIFDKVNYVTTEIEKALRMSLVIKADVKVEVNVKEIW